MQHYPATVVTALGGMVQEPGARRYCAVVFSDLERHSLAWSRVGREQVVRLIAEYRYLAEGLASQHGTLHLNFTGDGHMFLFENADSAVQFGLRLIDRWRGRAGPDDGMPHMPLRLGCHFGECSRLDGDEAWVGRAIAVAKRVEEAAEPDRFYLTENTLELIDVPLYRFEHAGRHNLKGDFLPERPLYQISAFDQDALLGKPAEELTPEAWFLKGVALIGTTAEGGLEEEQCYREALRLRPAYPEALNNLAVLEKAKGEVAAAEDLYRQALRQRPDYPEAHYNRALLLAELGRADEAAAEFGEALRLRPEYVDAHHGYAALLRLQGRLAEARHHYGETLRLRPDYAEAYGNFAMLLEDEGDTDGARQAYESALRLKPDFLHAHYNLALLLDASGDEPGAERHYREAVRLCPDVPEAHNNLAALLHGRGEFAEAERHYCEALRLRPDDPQAHYNYALLLRAKGEVSAAERHLQKASGLAKPGSGGGPRH